MRCSRPLHGGADRNEPSAFGALVLDEVAPYTGARIENGDGAWSENRREVAPYTGARIETPMFPQTHGQGGVAPYTGARIETPPPCSHAKR